MIEKAVDNKKISGALRTDLSKGFDSISNDLLIAKLHAYRLSFPALKMMQDYLQNRKQRTKVGTVHINSEDILAAVPQGSSLEPILLTFSYVTCFWIKEIIISLTTQMMQLLT